MVVASIKPYEYSYSVHLVGMEILKKTLRASFSLDSDGQMVEAAVVV